MKALRAGEEKLLRRFDFMPLPNHNYLHAATGIVVGDLHSRNVLVAPNGQLLVFDPVISLRPAY